MMKNLYLRKYPYFLPGGGYALTLPIKPAIS